ncbi:hypothetical protein [Hamadaea tsunoensis]|uniref:hypothetical protein n=1 Tax=Hamadaea tsunoensis TaxID=53368 RepID=UPI000684224E|nr:hypothetical protein [Hamadaea tsunoensis]
MSRRAGAVLLVVIVAAAGAVWWATHRRPAPAPAACTIPDSVAAAPDASGGVITVLEKGFSRQRRTADSGAEGVSMGAVVRNTGSRVAYRTRITFQVFDAAHHDVARPRSLQLVQEIPVLMPGERIGVGAFAYVAGTGQAVSIDVLPSGTRWIDPAVLGAYRPVTAAYAGTSSNAPPTVSMTVDSANCRALDSRGGAVVYRAANGTIVGGDEAPLRSAGDQVCRPGTATAFLDATADAPEQRAAARTEAYAYCDLEPKPFGADVPWN